MTELGFPLFQINKTLIRRPFWSASKHYFYVVSLIFSYFHWFFFAQTLLAEEACHMFYELTNKLTHQNHCLFIIVNSHKPIRAGPGE